MTLTKAVDQILAEDKTGLLARHPSWKRVLLRDVADILNGYPFDSIYFNHVEGVPLIRIRDVVNGKSDTRYSGFYREQFLVQPGELLVGMDGDFNSARWQSSPGLLNQRVCKVTPNESLYSGRLLELVQPGYLAAIHRQTSSITVKHLSSRTIGEIALPLPPRSEQTRIVEKLEELLSGLDAGVAELEAAQKKLVKYRQSLLKAAVDGSLTASWRETQRQQHGEPKETGAQLLECILTERRAHWEARQLAKFKEQGKTPPAGWSARYVELERPAMTKLRELPNTWAWSTIDQLAQVGTGVTPLRSKPAYFDEGTFAWVTSGAVNSEFVRQASEFVTELALKECRLEVFPAGSLLIAMYGEGKTRGKTSELAIPATINQALAAVVLTSTARAFKPFVKSFLLSHYERMREKASGGVQPNLNLQIVKSIAVPLPPADEQVEVARVLEMQLEQVEQQVAAVAHGLKQSAAQRKNILQAAFSGRLVPQDPNDEPASVLLARIRAERASHAGNVARRDAKEADSMNNDAAFLRGLVRELISQPRETE